MNDPFAMLDPVQKPGSSPLMPWECDDDASAATDVPNGANFMTQQGPPAFGGLGGGNQQFATYTPYQQQMPAPAPVMMMPPQMHMQPQMQPQFQLNQSNAPTKLMPMPTYSGEPIMYDNIKNVMKPADPFATAPPTFAPPSHQTRDPKSTVVDFDPFSPKGATPRTPFDFPDDATATNTSSGSNDRLSSFGGKRPTQEEQRSQLGFSSEGFAAASAKPLQHRISLRDTNNEDNTPYFLEGNDAFMHSNFANLDDFDTNTTRRGSGNERSSANPPAESTEISEECGRDEYDVRFESGRKLGVLMERETAVVKLVVENGAADRVGVSTGSTVVAINRKSVENETYIVILDMIKAAPRPLRMRFQRGSQSKDTTQGTILTRISNGTFSVGNLTSGNATWTTKYFAFGGSKMDVLQLFVSRAAYHECVIALYEKRGVHTQIQSFRLCRDHKISPIKCKIYKGYGNLHYFSLTVPSLRFVAAKFASDDYAIIKNIWSNTYDAIERKKRMAY
ncbi:PDZ domain [Phytophthora cactorum]|nr:PDZ domain [Phytophthora cactorum]